MFSIGLVEDFKRNSVNIFDCLAFGLFETVTGSLTNGIHKLGKFIECKAKILFKIA